MRPGWPWLWIAAGGSIIAMTTFATTLHRSGVAIVAQIFCMALMATAVAANAPVWRQAEQSQATMPPAAALARMTWLTALAYGWSGLAMFAMYVLTPLRWQHGWQYGLAMALLAISNILYVRRLETHNSDTGIASSEAVAKVVYLNALQGILISAALIWLIASGKLDTPKADWAANDVFLAGGFAIVIISAVVVKTHSALTAPRSRIEN